MIPESYTDLGFTRYRGLLSIASDNGENFGRQLASMFNKKVFLLDSGSSALCLASKIVSLNRNTAKYVGCAAYTCPSVPKSIEQAGLLPFFIDTQSEDWRFSLDWSKAAAKLDGTLGAVVSNHLFGDIREQKAGSDEVLEIADVSQCFPTPRIARVIQQSDMAVLSFGAGKPLPLMGGGALLVDFNLMLPPDLPEVPKLTLNGFPNLALYPLLLKPLVWRYLRRMLQSGEIMKKPVSRDKVRVLSRSRSVVGGMVLPELVAQDIQHQQFFEQLHELFADSKFSTPYESAADHSGVRIGLVAESEALAKKLVEQSLDFGIQSSKMYDESLDSTCPNSKKLASRLVSFPCHSLLDIELAKKVFSSL